MVELAIAVTTHAGVTHRIGELLEVLQKFPDNKQGSNVTDKQVGERTNFGFVPSTQINGNVNLVYVLMLKFKRIKN